MARVRWIPVPDRAGGRLQPTPARAAHLRTRSLFGVVAGVVAMQVVLMAFSTGVHRDWEPIEKDGAGGDTVTQRWYYEGIAESHYSRSGARMTGNAYLPDRPVGVVLGDSYVEARQLPDQSTIGSVLERAARRGGVELNVRQYGFSGASSARYAVIGPDVLHRWNPPFVVVVLTDDDFMGGAPFVGEFTLAMRPDSTVIARHVAPHRTATVTRLRNAAAALLESITLADKLVVRTTRLLEGAASAPVGTPGAGPDREAEAVYASVRALRDAYDDRVAIIYVPDIAAVAADDRDRNEARVLAACRSLGARCMSAGVALRADRNANLRLSRGFANSAPAAGHLNAVGASIVAGVAWSAVRPLVERGTPPRP
ncbi:MAG: hypothetical protein ABIY52_13620 [Gemmatimonadaceae bacterium]